jgi:hypothetical protein
MNRAARPASLIRDTPAPFEDPGGSSRPTALAPSAIVTSAPIELPQPTVPASMRALDTAKLLLHIYQYTALLDFFPSTANHFFM